MHGHLATRQIVARQFRNGKELGIVDEDRHYDFNYQQYKMLQKPAVFKGVRNIVLYSMLYKLSHHHEYDKKLIVNQSWQKIARLKRRNKK